MFVDPRNSPEPPFAGTRPAPAEDVGELAELIHFCRSGRIYEVERWIRAGKPIHARQYRSHVKRSLQSPLHIAVDTNQFDLTVLLLANGVPPDSGDESLLLRVLWNKQFEFFDLLVAWGADPLQVDAQTVLDTYDADLYERFWRLGMDFTKDHALARTLADHSSNRPAYGWARHHKDEPRIARELAVGLSHAVVEKRERAVALLLWAGADAHRRAPDLRWDREEDSDEEGSSAIDMAVLYGQGHLLPTLKPDPARDNFEELWSHAADPASIEYLAKVQTPKDWSRTLLTNLRQIIWGWTSDSRAMQCVEKLTVTYGARLTSADADDIAGLRRDILKSKNEYNCRWALRWMSYPETCEPTVFAELTRTPAVRAKVDSLRIHDARYR